MLCSEQSIVSRYALAALAAGVLLWRSILLPFRTATADSRQQVAGLDPETRVRFAPPDIIAPRFDEEPAPFRMTGGARPQ